MFLQGEEFLEWGQWSDQKPLDLGYRNQISGICNLPIIDTLIAEKW
jgi:hypothetical protein